MRLLRCCEGSEALFGALLLRRARCEGSEVLFGALLRCCQCLEVLFSVCPQLGYLLWEGQQVIGKNQATEFAPPLGSLLEYADQIMEFFDGKRHMFFSRRSRTCPASVGPNRISSDVPTLRRVHTAQCMDIVTGSECVFQCS